MGPASANLWFWLALGVAGILTLTKKLKKEVKPDFGAFVDRLLLYMPTPRHFPQAPHPLDGLIFAVSDIFDIDGFVTGFGNPDWPRTRGLASQTSSAVSALVEGGATCYGKTVVDDMAFGISGVNKHYDTPTNPIAPARVPGGSSSGAAVAVAANLVDFSLGIDTVGGVRIPAGYCGVLGFRPSHGTVSQMGIIPVSASLDTVGWFARDPHSLRLVGDVLLQTPLAVHPNPRSIIIADDCFQISNVYADLVIQAVIISIKMLYGGQAIRHVKLGDYLNSTVPSLKAFPTDKSSDELKTSLLWSLAKVMQALRRHEFKQNHEEWIVLMKPTLDPVISAELRKELHLTDMEAENCQSVRREMRRALNLLLKDDGILVIPTTIDLPPKLGSEEIWSEDYQIRASTLTSLASMSGCCQAAVTMGFPEKWPVSVSFVARHGGDRFLLATIETMHSVLLEQATLITK